MAELKPQNNLPVGTIDEITALGMDPKKVGTCSLHTSDSIGCPWYRRCRFAQWRDQMHGLKGPVNIGTEVILSQQDGGAWAQAEMPCFGWYESGLAERARQAPETGEIVRVIAYEGDGKKIKHRCSRRAPNQPPGDNRTENYIDEREVRPFERPAQRFPVIKYAQEAREEFMDEVERDALQRVLEKNAPTPPVGEGRKVTKPRE